jgi:hypothetical protein
MKKILLALLMCCAFSMLGIATNSDAKLKRVEMLEQKINALKLERANIHRKFLPIQDEIEVVSKKKDAIRKKIINLKCNNEAWSVAYFKDLIEKKKNEIKELTLWTAKDNLLLDISKINLSIDKVNIELIKAEIKEGKTPKIPLDVAKALIKHTKSWIKVNEATIEIKQAKIKEKEANIKYFANIIETGDKSDEINKNTNHSYDYIYSTNIEIAELKVKRAGLILQREQARRDTIYARIKEARAGTEFCKIAHKFCKTLLKFNKVVDEKTFMSFLNHN